MRRVAAVVAVIAVAVIAARVAVPSSASHFRYSAALTCGVERWKVKTLQDRPACSAQTRSRSLSCPCVRIPGRELSLPPAAMAADQTRVTIGEVVKIGHDLTAELERLARKENGDATWLAKRVLDDYVRRQGDDVNVAPGVPGRASWSP